MKALALAGLVAVATGCATVREAGVLPADEQYALAISLHEQEKYVEAVSAFQTFSFNYPQDPRNVEVRWLTAEAYFGAEDWATAAQEYLNFQRDYPSHERADDALYQAGRSYQELSLRPELDQRDTIRSINVFDRLLREYPSSEWVAEGRERRSQLRDKLAEKVYLNAEFYFDHEEYDAAEIYLVDLIENHSDSSWLPAGYALLAVTFCEQGLRDRAGEVFQRLVESFPDSRAIDEARDRLPGECRSAAAGPAVEANGPTDGR